MGWKHIGFTALALLAGGMVASRGQAPAASGGDTPARPGALHVLSAADHDLFTRAFAAAAKSDWATAISLGNQGQDTTARQLLQWRYALDRNSGANFADIDAALKMAADWPLRGTLLARAETAMPLDMPSADIVRWFGSRAPASPIGRVRLGEALVATGETSRGGALIRQGWSEGSFDEATETAILARDAAHLTPDSQRVRLDGLLWRGEFTAARRQIGRVDRRSAELGQARVALASGLAKAKKALAKVSGSSDPALLYDWSRALRIANKDSDAHVMLLRIDPTILARDHTQRWWNEVASQARDALADGKPGLALKLVNHAALPVGDQYADQQFLAGFISLRLLKDPAGALVYFQHLGANVSRPISKARAEYWQGRAYEASGDPAAAYDHYRLAAVYSDTFYGQLAIARTEVEPILHLADTMVEPVPKARIENGALMPQIRVLAELDLNDDLRLFATREASGHTSPAYLKQFLATLRDWGYPQIAVRLAKTSSYSGVPRLEFSYPVLALPSFAGSGTPPQPALVHAVIRQETEFNAEAISSAGARGLMQVMLAAAKTSARLGNLHYRPNDLLTDVTYNMQRGMIELARHYGSWDNSIVLTAAAYNAGPGNVRKWVATYGDPSSGKVDAIDWIEQIPFGETRNYVQRILENLEVYRNRLAGTDQPLSILRDLYGPAPAPAVAVLAPPAKIRERGN
ncbi:MAG: transglycosylase SLT domain-containing protein [Alphaproteobacteria bacterium]|nr:transglycosylase SLT domain-containing protein [Alphaproteobacteria bacterium]